MGAASLIAAAGYITPRAGDNHPALLARHVLSMLRTTRLSFPACLMINSFQGYSAEVETRAEYVGGTTVVRDRIAEQRCPRAIVQPKRQRSTPCFVRCLGQRPRRPFTRPTDSLSRSTF